MAVNEFIFVLFFLMFGHEFIGFEFETVTHHLLF